MSQHLKTSSDFPPALTEFTTTFFFVCCESSVHIKELPQPSFSYVYTCGCAPHTRSTCARAGVGTGAGAAELTADPRRSVSLYSQYHLSNVNMCS